MPKTIPIDTLKTNERNPRKIAPARLELLKKSITDFEKMLSLRPIVVDELNVCLGGNMRLTALKALGYTEIPADWIKRADDLTADEKREFIIKDNADFGDWDFDLLAEDWTADELTDWGVDLPKGFGEVDPGTAAGETQIFDGSKLYFGDCLEIMATFPAGVIDCVLTDPPYGSTACSWDAVIPFGPMWKQLKRITKPNAAICLFSNQPFSSNLVMSNLDDFKFEWIWSKRMVSNVGNAKKMPLRAHETINVFYQEQPDYFPQKEKSETSRFGKASKSNSIITGKLGLNYQEDVGYPKTILDFPRPNNLVDDGGLHPTQKPVELLRYLIRTYSREGQTILDFTMGSGSAGVACEHENRNFIGIENDAKYFEIAKKRIAEVKNTVMEQ